MPHCLNCKQESILISGSLRLCARCIKNHFNTISHQIKKIHAVSREKFSLPSEPPRDTSGIHCDCCVNECLIGDGEMGYCGLRKNKGGRLTGPSKTEGTLSSYYDALPTNCVGDWVCAGGTGTGYPRFSYTEGPEYGYKNLAVFYHGCTFNCLFCQNWHFKEYMKNHKNVSASDLADDVDSRTSCICYFGGDPTPQLSHAIAAANMVLKQKKNKILRICWETNGSMNQRLLKKALDLSLQSGGCIKFDLKCWNEHLHVALCGVSNQQTLQNFAFASQWFRQREDPPLLIASTLLVPGYIDEEEVFQIASFIARRNPDIPYSLLGFHPHFFMKDLPRTSYKHAELCRQAAEEAGLRRIRVGNVHLLGDDY